MKDGASGASLRTARPEFERENTAHAPRSRYRQNRLRLPPSTSLIPGPPSRSPFSYFPPLDSTRLELPPLSLAACEPYKGTCPSTAPTAHHRPEPNALSTSYRRRSLVSRHSHWPAADCSRRFVIAFDPAATFHGPRHAVPPPSPSPSPSLANAPVTVCSHTKSAHAQHTLPNLISTASRRRVYAVLRVVQ